VIEVNSLIKSQNFAGSESPDVIGNIKGTSAKMTFHHHNQNTRLFCIEESEIALRKKKKRYENKRPGTFNKGSRSTRKILNPPRRYSSCDTGEKSELRLAGGEQGKDSQLDFPS